MLRCSVSYEFALLKRSFPLKNCPASRKIGKNSFFGSKFGSDTFENRFFCSSGVKTGALKHSVRTESQKIIGEKREKLHKSLPASRLKNMPRAVDTNTLVPGVILEKRKEDPIDLTEARRLQILGEIGDTNTVPSMEKCEEIRENLARKRRGGEKFVDSVIIEVLGEEKAYTFGQTYLKFLLEKGLINPGTAMQAVTLCYNCKTMHSKDFDSDLAAKLLEKLEKLLRISPLLRSYLILLLCANNRWREALDFMAEISDSQLVHPGAKARSLEAVAICCFEEGEATEGWKLLKELSQHSNNFLSEFAQLSILSHAELEAENAGVDASLITIGRFMKLLNRMHVYPKLSVVEKIKEHFEKIRTLDDAVDFQVEQTTVSSKTAKCDTCGEKLEPVFIHPDEYRELHHEIFDKLITGQDVHNHSFPAEVKSFLKFIDENLQKEPFDLVVDGLNVYYQLGNMNPIDRMHKLCETVEALKPSSSFKRVLIIARDHIVKYKRKDESAQAAYSRLHGCGTVFLVDHNTRDDGFFLYAAVKNGPRTWLLSNDRFGAELQTLAGTNAQKILKRYLAKRQIMVQVKDKPIFYFPMKHEVVTQAGAGAKCWHVPFDDGSDRYSYQYPNDWLCITRRED